MRMFVNISGNFLITCDAYLGFLPLIAVPHLRKACSMRV